jgi:hypothetical protein
VKLMLSIVANKDLECKQFDLITALLNALVKNYKIYVEQPHGYEEKSSNSNTLVCLLQRALYGLKQSPLLWYDELTAFLRSISLLLSLSDPCLFIYQATGAYLLIYVDDLLIMTISTGIIDEIAYKLSQKFPLKELGNVAYFLGCRIIRNRKAHKLWITQDAFINHIAQRFNIIRRKTLTLMKEGLKLCAAPAGYSSTRA